VAGVVVDADVVPVVVGVGVVVWPADVVGGGGGVPCPAWKKKLSDELSLCADARTHPSHCVRADQ
jgi:hypothetical protein